MRRPIAVFAVLVVIATAAYALFASAFPKAVVVPRVLAAVERSTGMRVRVDGAIGFTVFPRPTITMTGAVLENRDRKVPLGDVVARLKLMPLLSGDIAYADVVLTGAVLDFSISGASPVPVKRILDGLLAGRLGSMEVRQARVSIALDKARTERFANVDFTLRRAGAAGIALDGTGDWRGERTTLALLFGDVPHMQAGSPAQARMTLATPTGTLGLDGRAAFGANANFDGSIDLATTDAARLVGRFGWRAGGLPTAQTIHVGGTGQMTPGHMAIRDARFDLGTATALGAFALHWSQPRIVVQGTLAFDRLAIDATGLSWQPLSRVKEMDIALPSFLENPVDLDLRLSVANLTLDRLAATRVAGSLIARKGHVSLDLGEAMLFGGQVRGRVALARDGTKLDLTTDLTANTLDLATLLAPYPAAAGISGALTAKIAAKTRCGTVDACIEAAHGAVTITGTGIAVPAVMLESWLKGAGPDGEPLAFGALADATVSAAGGLAAGRIAVTDLSLGQAGTVGLKALTYDLRSGVFRAEGLVRKALPVAAPAADAAAGQTEDAAAAKASPEVAPAREPQDAGSGESLASAGPAWSFDFAGFLPILALPGWWSAP